MPRSRCGTPFHLSYTERNLHAAGLLHVEIVDEDALCRLGTQINLHRSVGRCAHLSREHQVKLSHVGPVLCAADRIDNLLVDYYLLQCLEVRTLHSLGIAGVQSVALLLGLLYALACGQILLLVKRVAEALASLSHFFLYLLVIFRYLVLDEHVSAIAFLRVAVVDKWVVKRIDMSACLPYSRMHKDGGVDTHDILVQQHHTLPPVLLDVVFQFHTILSVVMYGSQSVIDFAAREHESVFLAVGHDFLKNVFLCHNIMYNFRFLGAKVM